MRETWRERAAPVIARAIEDAKAAGLTGRDLLNHVQAFYPFGPRRYHPYRVWLDEIRVQLGRRPKRQVRSSRSPAQGQQALF